MTSGTWRAGERLSRLAAMPRLARLPHLSTAHALRAAGLAVWLVVACTHYLGLQRPSAQGPMPQLIGLHLSEVLTALLLGVFAACLWINLREAPVERPTRGHRWRLVAQLAAGMLVHTDLMYVVAGQAALVLEARQASRWLLLQTLLLAAWAALLWHLGAFEPLPAFARSPAPLAFGVTLLSLLTWQAFAFCVGWLAAREARQRRAFALVNAHLQAAQQELAEQSRLEERLHISRELHDSLGHHLVALSLQLGLAQRVPGERRAAHVAAASELAQGMLGEVRRVVSALREEPALDLPAALAALQAAVPEPRVHLQVDEALPELTAAQAHMLLRCAQEAVNNTLRHAAAQNIRLALTAADERTVLLTVQDDGVGSAELRCGNGLTGMRERVAAAGATMELQCAAGQGFRIAVRVGVGAEALP